MIDVTIPGEPHAQMRHRVRKLGTFVQTYDAPQSRSWKAFASDLMQRAMAGRAPLEGNVELTIRAFWECPTSKHLKKGVRPRCWRQGRKDADNIAKAVQDAGNGVLWIDDRQVVRLHVEKIQAAQGEAPRTEIVVRVLRDPPERITWEMETSDDGTCFECGHDHGKGPECTATWSHPRCGRCGGALQCYGNDKDGVEQEFLVSGVAYGIVSQLPPDRCEVCNPELKKPKLAVVHKMPTALDNGSGET